MSSQFEDCSLCDEPTLVSCTNGDADLGLSYINNKLICSDCKDELLKLNEKETKQ